jgi:DNA-directed RNA polymerase specialized sigma24 family protein
MDVWDKLDDAQYRWRLSLGDPGVIDEVFHFLLKYVGNQFAIKHKDLCKNIRDFTLDITMITVEAIFEAIDEGLKEGRPKRFNSRAALLKFVNDTAYHKAIDQLRKQKTQKKYFTQLGTGEGEDDERDSWEEKIAGGKSQAFRASQDASDQVYNIICLRLALKPLKKEYRDLLVEVFVFDAQGNLIEDGTTFNFASYAKRVGKSLMAVRETFRRAKTQWLKNFKVYLVRD